MSKEYRIEDEYGRKIGTLRPQQSIDGSCIFIIIIGSILLLFAPLVGPYIFIKGKLLNRWEEIGGWTKFIGFTASLIGVGAAIYVLIGIGLAIGDSKGFDFKLPIVYCIMGLIVEGIPLFYILSKWLIKKPQNQIL
jgi:hypothetical protein